MNGQDAVEYLKFATNRSSTASSEFEANILLELQRAQGRLERSPILPQFLLTEESYIDLSEDEPRVPKPTNYLREYPAGELRVEDTVGAPGEKKILVKRTLDYVQQRYLDTATGLPRVYADSGEYFRLWPVPDSDNYRLWLIYYKKDDAITLGGENDWLKHFPDLLIAEAGFQLASTLKNGEAIQKFQLMRAEERQRYLASVVGEEEANFDPNPED